MINNFTVHSFNKFKYIKNIYKNDVISILDVGCGNNSAIKTKKYFPNCKYYGLDLDRTYNNNEKNFSLMEEFYEIDLSKGDISNLPDSFFDVIIISHVIEHLVNGLEVLSLLNSKLKVGGYIYIETPHIRSLFFPSSKGTLNFFDDTTHVRIYTIHEVINSLLSSNYKIYKVGTRRNILRILATPFYVTYLLLKGKSVGGAFWDILGFAFFTIGKKAN